jgi:hypothetical protein
MERHFYWEWQMTLVIPQQNGTARYHDTSKQTKQETEQQ